MRQVPSRRFPGESEVTRALARGDVDGAAEALLVRLGPEILGFLRRLLPTETDAGDAFAAFAEDVWRGLAGWRGESSLRAWAYRVAHHAAARVLRDPWRRRRSPLVEEAVEPVAAEMVDDPGESPEPDGRASALAALRLALSPEDDELLEWRGVRGIPWRTITAFRTWKGDPSREVALRKRFQRIKARLAREARARGRGMGPPP
jgi:RNA polymerase sigma-70 factor, ECF subfamily